MAQTAGQVMGAVRSLLNDDDEVLFPDYKLFPKLTLAQNELFNRLALGSNQNTFEQSAILSVVANAVDGVHTDLTAVSGYPTDLLIPLYLKERAVGETDSQFIRMDFVEFIPNTTKTNLLRYWTWRKNKLYVLGSTVAREVLIRYRRTLTVSTLLADDTVVSAAETWLTYKTAALVLISLPGDPDPRIPEYKDMAKQNEDIFMMLNTKNRQNIATRRKGYRQHAKSISVF